MAIESYRRDNGFDEYFNLNSPATCEKIRMACVDDFTREAVGDESYLKFEARASY